jgi:hypothetical protein
MRFVLVNDRMPRKQSFCVLCGEPIGTSYLRETGTRLFYCDHECYAGHCKSAALSLANLAKASWVTLASNNRTSEQLTAK